MEFTGFDSKFPCAVLSGSGILARENSPESKSRRLADKLNFLCKTARLVPIVSRRLLTLEISWKFKFAITMTSPAIKQLGLPKWLSFQHTAQHGSTILVSETNV